MITTDNKPFVADAGQPWRQQYIINSSENEDITGWIEVGNLPEPLRDFQVVVTKNRIYLLGGFNGCSLVDTVYTASINDDGVIGEWTKFDSLPGPSFDSQVIVTNNRVYLLGDCSWCGGIDVMSTASINEDGSISKWVRDNSLPEPLFNSQVVIVKNRVYLLGGFKKYSSSNKVYTTLIKEDGTLDRWEEYDFLPRPLGGFQSVITKNRIYLLGGYTDWINMVSTVYTADIKDDGTIGEWITNDPLPKTLSKFQVVVTNNKIYLLGGYDYDRNKGIGNAVDNVYIANISEDGALGKWTIGSPLPKSLYSFQVVITKNHIYLLGGCGSEGYSSSIYTATFNGGLNDYSQYYSSSK